MAIKKAQKDSVVKPSSTKKTPNPANDYPNNKGFGGGEGKIPSGPTKGRVQPTYGGAKNGGTVNKTVKTCKTGCK